MGLLAFAVVMARSVINNGPVDATIGRAVASMIAFAAAGLVLGRVAQFVVDDSVRGELTLAIQETANQKKRNDAKLPPTRESEPAAAKQPG